MVEAQEVKDSINLTDLISEYTPVRRKLAKCPFHPDKTPSLSVSEAKGLWNCFSCNVGGDALTFLMMAEGISFPQALRSLAIKAGVPLPDATHANFEQRRSEITAKREELRKLAQEKNERLSSIKEEDKFLGNLWKRTIRRNWSCKVQILDLVESCFSGIDNQYGRVGEWFNDENRKVYRKTSN